MEIFRDTNYDFLGKKNIFIGLSVVLLLASVASLLINGGPRYGIDFRGGALIYVRFQQQPPVEQIRSSLASKVAGEVTVQDLTQSNEVIIGTELADEQQLDQARRNIVQTLTETFGDPQSGKLDLNNVGRAALVERLRDPLLQSGVAMSDTDLEALADRIPSRAGAAGVHGALRHPQR